jgi:hypothetical protein
MHKANLSAPMPGRFINSLGSGSMSMDLLFFIVEVQVFSRMSTTKRLKSGEANNSFAATARRRSTCSVLSENVVRIL